MISEEIIADMDLARDILSSESCSIVVIKDKKIITKKQGMGVRPILEVIDDLGESLKNTIIGDRILGKASALLCAYAKVAGVYSPKATKTGLAVLIRAGIPGQTDQLIPFIQNKYGTDVCPFEKLLKEIDSPDDAFEILNKNILQKSDK
jgi:hypothetical protein